MSERIQRRRSRQEVDETQAAEVTRAGASAKAVDYDALLAEIDDLLETDADDYVRSFVQKGGQ